MTKSLVDPKKPVLLPASKGLLAYVIVNYCNNCPDLMGGFSLLPKTGDGQGWVIEPCPQSAVRRGAESEPDIQKPKAKN